MKNTRLKKKILSIVLSLVIVAGMITAPTVINTNATGKEVEFSIEKKYIEIDNSWYFTADNVSQFTAEYYKGIVKVDGKEVEVPFQKTSDGFVIWSTLFDAIDSTGKVPTTSMEISKDTVLEEVDPNATTGWGTAVLEGQTLKVANTISYRQVNGSWISADELGKEAISASVGFEKVDDNSWYFKSDDLSSTNVRFFKGKIKVDGKDVEVPFEKISTGLVIWANLFGVIQSEGQAPTKTLEIPIGTVLYEIDPESVSGWSTAVANGQQIVTTNTLTVSKENADWVVTKGDDTKIDVEFSIDYKEIDATGSWYFKVNDTSKFTAEYYKGRIKIDGKEVEVPFQKINDGFVVWSTLFNAIDAAGKAPTTSVEISKNTILEEINPFTTGWGTATKNGQKLKTTNTLMMEGIAGVWNKVTEGQTTVNVGLTYQLVDGENSWYFSLDDRSKATAQYYHGTIKVDGKDVKVVFDNSAAGFIIWNNFFSAIMSEGTTPTAKLEIPEGTILYEVNPHTTGWGTPVEGGQSLKIVNKISYVKKNNIWTSSDEVAKEPLYAAMEFDFVEVDDSWFFNCKAASKTDVKYFKVTVKIDGKKIEVPLEKTEKGFVIWPSLFNAIQPDGKVPTKKLEIPVGTVLYEINPTVTGWKEAVTNGQQIITTNTLTVKKENVGWTTGKGITPISLKLGKGMGIYNKGTENEVFSIVLDGPESIKKTNLTVKGTMNIDGIDREGIVFIPDNGELFIYTLGAKNAIKISKDTDFVSSDKKTVIRFDKNYEIDLVKQIYYEQGKKPSEKKALDVAITYDRLVGQSFMFSWKMTGDKKPVAGWYRTEAVLDGKTRTILMEYTTQDESFFIYPNCFNDIPVEKTEGYPEKHFKMKKGTKITPVVVGTWADDVLGQPYTLTNDIDVTKNGTIWMNTSYMEKIETIKPLEVKVVFKQIMNSAAVFEVITPDGKNIDATYGDWTQARGMIMRGVQNDKTKKYSYTSEYAAYSISGNTFYIDGLRLNELEGLQIDKNTVLYPDSVCASDIPIKIVNQVRIVRDENDEWVVDTKFTTAIPKVDTTETENEQTSDSSSGDTVESVVTDLPTSLGAVLESENNKKNNYLDGNIVFATDTEDDTTEHTLGYELVNAKEGNFAVWIVIAAVIVVLAGCGIIILLTRKRRDTKE